MKIIPFSPEHTRMVMSIQCRKKLIFSAFCHANYISITEPNALQLHACMSELLSFRRLQFIASAGCRYLCAGR